MLAGRGFALPEIVANAGNLGALVAALHQGNLQLLGRAIDDRLVEPVRAPMIPAYADVRAAARDSGSLAGHLGSGPSMFALCDSDDVAARNRVGHAPRLQAARRPRQRGMGRPVNAKALAFFRSMRLTSTNQRAPVVGVREALRRALRPTAGSISRRPAAARRDGPRVLARPAVRAVSRRLARRLLAGSSARTSSTGSSATR